MCDSFMYLYIWKQLTWQLITKSLKDDRAYCKNPMWSSGEIRWSSHMSLHVQRNKLIWDHKIQSLIKHWRAEVEKCGGNSGGDRHQIRWRGWGGLKEVYRLTADIWGACRGFKGRWREQCVRSSWGGKIHPLEKAKEVQRF